MTRRKIGLTALIAALFGMALVLTGCPTEAEPSAEEKAATALAAELGADNATASGTTVTLKKAVPRDADLTVPAGVTLSTGASTLTINDGKAFKVDGIVDVPTGGTLNLGTTGTGISTTSYLKGTINVSGILADKKTDGASFWPAGSSASTGKFVFSSGASATVGSAPMIGTVFSIGAGATFTMRAAFNTLPTYEIAGGTVTLNTNGVTVTHDQDLSVVSGSLAIVKDVTLIINGKLNVETAANVTGSAESTASIIVFGSGTYTSSSTGKTIFYPSGNTTAGQAVAGKTYNWSEHGDGSNGAAGWKAQ
jgi:hypothetical protein